MFELIDMISQIPEDTSSFSQKNHMKTTQSKNPTIYDVVTAFLEFYTIDFSIPNNQISFLDAFLPLFNSLIDAVIKSDRFSSNELENSWLFFQNEFRKVSHSLLTLNIKETYVELMNKSKFNDVLANLIYFYDTALKLIDFQSNISTCYSAYQNCVAKRYELFKQIENTKKQPWQDIIPTEIYSLMKVLEESMLYYCKISKLNELIFDLSLQKDFVKNTLKANVDFNKFFENMTKVIMILLRKLFSSEIYQNNEKIFLNLFSQINQINILTRTHIYYNIFDKWTRFSNYFGQILKIRLTDEEENAFNCLQDEINNGCINSPKLLMDFINVRDKFFEIKKSPQNYLFILNSFTILSEMVSLSESKKLTDAILKYMNFISRRICCLSISKILEKSFVFIEKFIGKESPKTHQIAKALTGAYEQIQMLGMKTNPDFEYEISRYKNYLTSIKAISNIDGYEQELFDLLSWHPKVEIVEKFFIPSETIERLISDMKMNFKNSPLNGLIEKLQNLTIGSENYSEKMFLIFQTLISHPLVFNDISDCFAGLNEYLNTVKLLNTKSGLFFRKTIDDFNLKMQIDLINTGFALVKDSNLSRQEKAELILALANLNLHTMYNNFDQKMVQTLDQKVLMALKVPVNTDAVKCVFSVLNHLESLNEHVTLDFYDRFYNFFTSLLFGNFPNIEEIEQNFNHLSAMIKKDSLDTGILEIKNYISNLNPLLTICQMMVESNPKRVIRYCFDFSLLQLISKELNFLLEYNLITNEKKNDITQLLASIDPILKCNFMSFVNDYEMKNIPGILLTNLRSLWPFVDFKKLYLSFASSLPVLFSLVSGSTFLKQIDFIEKLTKCDKFLKEFSFVQNKSSLLEVYNLLSHFPQMIQDKLSKNRQYRNVFEVVMFRKKIPGLIHYISSVLFMMNATFAQNPEIYNLIMNLRRVEFRDDSNLLSVKNNFYLFCLADVISPYDVSLIHYEESQTVNKQIKEEINQIKSKIENYEKSKQKKYEFEAKSIKKFEEELEISKTNRQKASENAKLLKKRKNQLKDQLLSMVSSKDEMNASENRMSAVLSLMVDDDFTKTENEVTFDDLLIENLKTNLRLKKTIELMKFPKIKPLLNAKEFYGIMDSLTITKDDDSVNSDEIYESKATLSKNLRNLNERRDNLFKKVVSENKYKFQTEDYYRMMVAISKTEIDENTPEESQLHFFLDFAESSDDFFFEVNEEIKILEAEISALEGNEQTEINYSLLKEMIFNCSGSK